MINKSKAIHYSLVSIVIPVYNGESFMREAIDSALVQTYKDIEIIVINDGSTDNTEEIAKSYGDKIRYYSKENGGVSTALNLALREMNGEYFSWLSHDDVYYPEKISRQIDQLASFEKENVVLYSNYDFIDEKSRITTTARFSHEMLVSKPEYALLRSAINGCTLLIPKKAFDEYGFFDENLKCTQDYDMWFRMMKTYDFMHMSEVLVKYRAHSQQDTVKNPRVVSEGNSLWIRMMDGLSHDQKNKLEGSEQRFYSEMAIFLNKTPYKLAAEHAESKLNEIQKSYSSLIRKLITKISIPTRWEWSNKLRFVIYSPKKFFNKHIVRRLWRVK